MSDRATPATISEGMLTITGATRVFGVIAHPTSHVRAPMVFNALFTERGLDHVMVPLDAPAEHLSTVLMGLRAMPNFGGMAVTIPHKVPIASLCDSLGEAARLTGAVNAVRRDPDGTLHGDNFDGEGFVAGLRQQGYDPAAQRVLMLGAGGAARAVALALCRAGAAEILISNRTEDKAQLIVDNLLPTAAACRVATAPDHDGAGVDMIINTTSLGLHDGDALPLALDGVGKDTLIADIIMVPKDTRWLQEARQRGLTVHYGHHMLDCQIELIGSFIGAL